MKNYGFLITLSFSLFFLGCSSGSEEEIIGFKEPANTDNDTIPEGYELVWADEFDESGRPNDEYWSFETGFVRNKELQWYQSENAVVKDGKLVIEGKRDQIMNPNYQKNSDDWKKRREYAEYTSSSINTRNKFSFKYGIMEVRARIDTRKGAWPAIWTLGTKRWWPDGGEVDVMEFYRVNGVPHILANFAWKGKKRWEPTWNGAKKTLSFFLDKDPLWDKKFHVWKMDWSRDYIRLYLDEELINEVKIDDVTYDDGFNPFREPHYILLNLAIGSNGGDPTETDFPIKYEVDYVRVFQKINNE